MTKDSTPTFAPADDDVTPAPPAFAAASAPSDAPPIDVRDYEAEAAALRQRAYDEASEGVWNGKRLFPWSQGRQSIHARLLALDLPGPDLDELSFYAAYLEARKREHPTEVLPTLPQLINFEALLPAAAKLLYLSSHKPEVLDDLRATPWRLIREIEKWTEANIAPDQVEEACWLAQRIRAAHRSAQAMHRPSKHDGRHDDSGN